MKQILLLFPREIGHFHLEIITSTNNDNFNTFNSNYKGTSNDLISDSYDDYDYNEVNDNESAPINKGQGLDACEDEIGESPNDEK